MSIKFVNVFCIILIVFCIQSCNKGEKQMVEQAVIVNFNYGSTDLTKLYDLEDELEQRLNNSSVGEFDGHDIAVDGSTVTLYFYGDEARQLYDTVKDILTKNPLLNRAKVTLRFGPPEEGVQQEVFIINQGNGSGS